MDQKEYFIGIDAGTSSVGWAVTDPTYHVIKKNGKALWGVRLFEEASTAEKRRMARSARRNGDRKAFRLKLLRELFAEEISKVDPAFYLRLDESKYWADDKKVSTKYCLFSDSQFTDQEYHKTYPTIYHLREELMNSDVPHDVRLVYLAVAHLVKHRGHFFLQMAEDATQPEFESCWTTLKEDLETIVGVHVSCGDTDKLQKVLCEKMPVREKQKELKKLIAVSDAPDMPPFTCIPDLLSGKTCDVSKSFGVSLEAEEKNALKISLAGEDLSDEEKMATYRQYLEEKMQILEDLKMLYDWGILVHILHGSSSISAAKVQSYEKHKSDLKKLQTLVRREFKDQYAEVFRQNKKKLDNYSAYTGHCKGAREPYRCNQEAFYKYLQKLLKSSASVDAKEILSEIELGAFLPMQRTNENSVIPYQMNLRELKQILEHAARYLPFLNERDESGLSMRDKIESLLTFRVPYYVGPLDNHLAKQGTHWAVKKHPEQRVYPWNFEKVVDLEASAEGFMKQLTNTCTYLIGESVLPKDSVIYGQFMVLNELNHVTIYGQRLPVDVKQKVFLELFCGQNRVTRKMLLGFLRNEGLIQKGEEEAVGGFDGDFKASLKVWNRLRTIFGEDLPDAEQMDEMILSVLLLKQEPDMLRSRIARLNPSITQTQLKSVCRLPCSGWGRLSKKFLTELKADVPQYGGSNWSILDALWNTDCNLMQLLSGDMPYQALVEEHNRELMDDVKLDYNTISNLSAPPAVRRTVWQTLRIVQEITHIMGGAPQKIFVEMARGSTGTGRTVSRKKQLSDLYQKMGEEGADWCAELDRYEDSRLRQDKLYLYFTQMGRCMYTGEPIDLNALLNDAGNQIYDIDHIYPRSKVKDDSLDNRVLVKKKVNEDKGDRYPIKSEIRQAQHSWWMKLRQCGLISEIKLDRLTRSTGFSEDELAGFISRQLVETRQSTKLMAEILNKALPESRIVYVKAGNVSSFRQQYDIIKVRDLNDLHHAKDAYLNIVVGNVYDVKFTANPRRFIGSGEQYSMKTEVLFGHTVKRGNRIAWQPEYLSDVKKTCRRNHIMVTRMAVRRNSGQNGGLYDQNPVRGGTIPLKGDPRMQNTERYGGYRGDTGAYMFLVEHGEAGKRVRSIEPLYLRYAQRVKDDPESLAVYCTEQLGLINPNIIVPEIKFNTLLEINGFQFWLTGRTGPSVVGMQSFQLSLPETDELYLKKVLKGCQKVSAAKGQIELDEKADRVTKEENERLYDVLLEKMQLPIYQSRPSNQVKTVSIGKENFAQLTLTEQCFTLQNLLQLFRGNGKADLTGIGGSKTAGTIIFSKKVGDGFKIIYQSVTGFYSHEETFSR